MEEPGVLQNHGVGLSQGGAGQLADLVAVHIDGAALCVIEPHQQIDDGGLACTGGADDGRQAAGFGVQAQILNDGSIRNIGEVHIFQLHIAADLLQNQRIGAVSGFGLFVDQAEYTLRSRKGALQFRHDIGDLVDRTGELARILHELCNAAKRDEKDGACRHNTALRIHIQNSAENGDEGNGKVVDKVDGRAERRAVILRLVVGVHRIGVARIEALSEANVKAAEESESKERKVEARTVFTDPGEGATEEEINEEYTRIGTAYNVAVEEVKEMIAVEDIKADLLASKAMALVKENALIK